MMRKMTVFGLVLILAALGSAQNRPTVEDLGWMAGDWRAALDRSLADRSCLAPAGQSMTCMMRVIAAEKVVWLEFSELRETSDGIVLATRFFSGNAEPAPPVSNLLRLRSAVGNVWTFENPNGTQPRIETITREGPTSMSAHAELVDSKGKVSYIDSKWERVP
jgi:Domain of unknown function (DUF6265)